MIYMKETEIGGNQGDNNKNTELDFQFYTVVNNLSAVERPPKSKIEKFSIWIKGFFGISG